MSNDGIQHFCSLCLFQVVISKRFFQCTTDKTIFCIRNSGLTILIHRTLNTLSHFITNTENSFRIRQSTHKTLYVQVVLQQLDRQEASGIFMADKFVLGNFIFYSINRFFQIGTMINVNMPEYTSGFLMFTHIVFQVFLFMVFPVFQRIMPFGQVSEHFRIHISLFIKKVDSFIEVNDHMKQSVQSAIFLTYRRQHRDTEQFAQ